MSESHYSRLQRISKIAEALVKNKYYENKATVDHIKIEIALDRYWAQLEAIKSKYQIIGNLDRHKVAACTSIYLFQEKPIVVRNSGSNGFLKIINHTFAIHAGFSNIGDSNLIPDPVYASIISQFDLNEYSILSLSAQYCLIEQLHN